MTLIPVRGASLFVKIMGEGYPVLLMHGGPGLDHTTLLSLEPLADQFKLVFYDHRCNGRSEGADPSSMSFENLTADAEALREELGFDHWALIGHSFGGNVALEYALRYPHSLSRLVLINSGADQRWVNEHAPALLAKRGYRADQVQAARRFFNGQLTKDEFTSTIMKFSQAYYYHFSYLHLLKVILSGNWPKTRAEALIYSYSQLLKGWNVMERLGEIKLPTLVLAGRHDFLFPPEHQALLADRLPNARLELIERAGHNPFDERQAEVLQILRGFLAVPDPAAFAREIQTG